MRKASSLSCSASEAAMASSHSWLTVRAISSHWRPSMAASRACPSSKLRSVHTENGAERMAKSKSETSLSLGTPVWREGPAKVLAIVSWKPPSRTAGIPCIPYIPANRGRQSCPQEPRGGGESAVPVCVEFVWNRARGWVVLAIGV
mmetsp:Transcript_6100/g.10421  ORF Transcript_6100/g.10421 Transcript_6100/m.10421 type:complete len:146 (-) Transcript_6100:3464-3901(-)